ncbi:MAG: hypothetical protein Q9180_008200 [Flavoplaca navasiana]
MDAYIASLEPKPFPPGAPSRDITPLLDGFKRVFTLREVISDRLEYLAWAVPGEEGDEMREEVKKLREMVDRWLSTKESTTHRHTNSMPQHTPNTSNIMDAFVKSLEAFDEDFFRYNPVGRSKITYPSPEHTQAHLVLLEFRYLLDARIKAITSMDGEAGSGPLKREFKKLRNMVLSWEVATV